MSSIRAASWPMKRSLSGSNAPSTASAWPSRLGSPQPTAPSSVSTPQKIHPGGARKVSIRAIFISLAGKLDLVHVAPGRVLVCMLGKLFDRHDQAHALRRKHVSPVGDQLLVGLADVADVTVEVEQPERIDVAILLAKRGVPVDLVGQRIPGEADRRDADVAQPQHVRP